MAKIQVYSSKTQGVAVHFLTVNRSWVPPPPDTAHTQGTPWQSHSAIRNNEQLTLHDTSSISFLAAPHSAPNPPHSRERTLLFCDGCLEGNCCHPAAMTTPTDF